MWPKRYREWRLWRKTAFDIPFRNTESSRTCARAWPEAIPIARPASRGEKLFRSGQRLDLQRAKRNGLALDLRNRAGFTLQPRRCIRGDVIPSEATLL